MNRKYCIDKYIEIIDAAKRLVPGISFAGDFISGFPTESDHDHSASLKLLEDIRYKNCFVFKYSVRPGTVAAKRYTDEVSEATKTSRVTELLAAQERIARVDSQKRVGEQLTVLVIGPSKRGTGDDGKLQLAGRTTDDRIVVFQGGEELIGQIVDIEIEKATALTLFGKRL